MGNFSRTLNFTSANEDGATELAALALKPGDHVLCLTASGARPLDLLLGDPLRITAIDINPAQNELLRLKIAAYRALDDDELYAYLGLSACEDRAALHTRVASRLGAPSHAFWDARRGAIRGGIWNAGRWERVLRLGTFGTGIVRGRHIDALFDAPSLPEQAEIWRTRFDDAIWHGAIGLLSQRWFWTRIIGEPGGAFLPDPEASKQRLSGLFRRAAGNFHFRDSDFASLLFRGRHSVDGALPLHLRRENLEIVRARLDRIEIAERSLADLGGPDAAAFDAFSLSDFGSYCGQADYDACWRGVLAAAKPGARFCERVFMNPVTASPQVASRIQTDRARSEALTSADKAIIYDIRLGTLASPS